MVVLHRFTIVFLLFVALLVTSLETREVNAAEPTGMLALAGPLAEQFGVPADIVTGLLENGISLDSVTQLLLVSQSSQTGLNDVANLYRESGNEIEKTAAKLDVAASEYSAEKVTAAIDEAKAKAQADASEKAGETASDAVDSVLGGFNKK
jgi:hypothetical protein